MKKSMDMFGRALEEYAKEKKVNFFFIDSNGKKHGHDFNRYFRKPNKLLKIEKELFNMATGKILDIGCGTANYFPAFKSNDILGIDISKKVIKLAKKARHNCIYQDIYEMKPDTKYDTITFLENNLGMANSPIGLNKLFNKLNELLNERGQILAITRRIKEEYKIVALTPTYNEIVGDKFTWLFMNATYLKRICKNFGFECKVVSKDDNYNLYRITRL